MEPNRKCWTTGSLPRTSAVNILTIPELTLSHVLTAEMSSSIGECHRRDAVLICTRIKVETTMRGLERDKACRAVSRQYPGRDDDREGRGTYRVDEADASKVHVVVPKLFENVWDVDRLWTQVLVA